MHYNSLSLSIFLVLTHLVIPLVIIIRLFTAKYSCVFDWLMFAVLTVSYNFLLYLVGYWGYASFYLRYLYIVLVAVSLFVSFRKVRRSPFYIYRIYINWLATGLYVVCTVIFSIYIADALRSCSYDTAPVNLSFPMKEGVYTVMEGGDGQISSLMNSHFVLSNDWEPERNTSMRYAVDIAELEGYGTCTTGLFPNEVGKFTIYGKTIYSPCDGTIVEVTDGMPDKVPFSGENYYSSGNTLVIKYDKYDDTAKYGDVYVTLVHLLSGSIRVKRGDTVKTGEPLAKVGNSGWSSEPHLHIQATRTRGSVLWEGDSIPITFAGRFPVKNSLFFIRR